MHPEALAKGWDPAARRLEGRLAARVAGEEAAALRGGAAAVSWRLLRSAPQHTHTHQPERVPAPSLQQAPEAVRFVEAAGRFVRPKDEQERKDRRAER